MLKNLSIIKKDTKRKTKPRYKHALVLIRGVNALDKQRKKSLYFEALF